MSQEPRRLRIGFGLLHRRKSTDAPWTSGSACARCSDSCASGFDRWNDRRSCSGAAGSAAGRPFAVDSTTALDARGARVKAFACSFTSEKKYFSTSLCTGGKKLSSLFWLACGYRQPSCHLKAICLTPACP